MSKLIELDAAIAETWKDTGYSDPLNVMTAIRDRLEALPPVDAVEVVRCKDCKYWKTVEGVNLSKRLKCCTYHIGHKYVRCDEDFCSRGEREEQ